MKMIGRCQFLRANSAWKSRPLRPGRRMSTIRQAAATTGLLSRNSAAEANAAASSPTDRSRPLRPSRMSASSSITQTTDISSVPPVRGEVLLEGPNDDHRRTALIDCSMIHSLELLAKVTGSEDARYCDAVRGWPAPAGYLRIGVNLGPTCKF